jgi:uncharacterized repeat protein (TIGR03803 family)
MGTAMSRGLNICWLGLSFAAALTVVCGPAEALTYKPLYAFKGGSDGAYPLGGVAVDSVGNIYGTTSQGGVAGCSHNFGCGTVFKVAPDGTKTTLFTFTDKHQGLMPEAPLIVDQAGNLYGTTLKGGRRCDEKYKPGQCGTVFKLAPDGTETVLHVFQGGFSGDGGKPQGAGLITDRRGNLYGVTPDGGNENYGTVFELTPTGKESVLFSFPGAGGGPFGTLLRDKAGNLYGTAVDGTIFRLSPDGIYTVLHTFGYDSDPRGGLIADSEGNLYGTTVAGGQIHDWCEWGCGTIFKLAPDGTLMTLYEFSGYDGVQYPEGKLVMDSEGNLYGNAASGVFELSTNNVLTYLGVYGNPDLVMDKKGNIYGTSFYGPYNGCQSNKDGCGYVWELHR